LKPRFSGRMLGGLVGGLLVVCTFGAITMSDAAAAMPANLERAWPTQTPTPDIAGIAIRVIDPPEHAWVQIQWSTWAKVNWYPVESWSGPLSQNENGWGAVWYERKDYGSGPFRWVVFDGNPAQGGQVWGMTIPFYLGYVGSFSIAEVTKGMNLAKVLPTVTPDPRKAFYSPQGAEFRANPEGCSHFTIAGEVLSASGKPLSDYRLRLTYPSALTETVNAGGALNYGKSGFGFLLGNHHPGQTYKLELLPMGQDWPVAPPVKIVFADDCKANEAWVVFQAVH
jgi:hypothetical protein